MFDLNDRLDTDELSRRFAAVGRVRIHDFLKKPSILSNHLQERDDWRQVLNSGDKVFELDRATRASLPPERTVALDQAVYAGASAGFQYRYETIRVSDEKEQRERAGDPLNAFADWLSQGAARELLRQICNAPEVAFADAQATAYSPGDFLTGHDDQVSGKNRHAAYVFGLTPRWRTEWGGLLLFHEGDAVSGACPGFNTLDLFAVPQVHSVSLVSPAATEKRLSITGWLRSRHD